MARKANADRLDALKSEIKRNPGRQPGFFARLLGWRREEVSRVLVSLNDQKFMLWEDEKGGLYPVQNQTDPD